MRVLGSWFLVLGAWCLVLGAWSLVLGAWSLVLRSLRSSRLVFARYEAPASYSLVTRLPPRIRSLRGSRLVTHWIEALPHYACPGWDFQFSVLKIPHSPFNPSPTPHCRLFSIPRQQYVKFLPIGREFNDIVIRNTQFSKRSAS